MVHILISNKKGLHCLYFSAILGFPYIHMYHKRETIWNQRESKRQRILLNTRVRKNTEDFEGYQGRCQRDGSICTALAA